jgi:hypothetical protein
MVLNFEQVLEKIKEIGSREKGRQKNVEGLQEKARQLLEAWSGKNEELREKVEHARRMDPNIRCAFPLEEDLCTYIIEPSLVNEQVNKTITLLAADGSQILPDRHAAVLYSLVNVGAIAMQPGSGQPPTIVTESNLLFADELYTDTGMISEEAINQRRDIAERRKLLDLAPSYLAPVVALTDGPLELWGGKDGNEEDYHRNLEIHQSILSQLQVRKVITAGYVDKPGADLVIRTLEIASFYKEEDFKNIRRLHPLRGISDRWLFGFLPPGSRSAVFGLQSSSRQHYNGDLALHFFYLNIGNEGQPWLVRVEIPKWVASERENLDQLHSSLLEQCRVMGSRPYPYILHRAHEEAVVKLDEKRQVEQMLELELRRSGSQIDKVSHKQSAKDLPGRRHK